MSTNATRKPKDGADIAYPIPVSPPTPPKKNRKVATEFSIANVNDPRTVVKKRGGVFAKFSMEDPVDSSEVAKNADKVAIAMLQEMLKEVNEHHKHLLEGIEAVIKVQKYDGNWNYDPYMHGLLNGMLFIQSMVESKPYEPYKAPKKWGRRPWWKFWYNFFNKPVAVTQREI